MKKLNKLFLSLLVLFASLIFIPYLSNAETHEVTNQESLVSAIEDAVDGDVIKLTNNIELTSPVSISEKKITIDGDGKSISKAAENWTPEGPNGTLLTAGGEGTKLTLKNITLKDAQKYGVQSYNGAHVVLDDVTISNNGFGGVLVNAGTVEIIKLHLGQNGQYDNNGIEIGKGDATGDKVPELIMNGTLSSDEETNVIYIATNNDKLTNFEVKNTENTTDKILVQGNKVVITDKDNKILYESNENSDLDFSGDEYVEQNDNPTDDPETGKPSGDSGTQNPSGDSETQNPSGNTGTQNPSGNTGAQNPSGNTGAQNPSGNTGAQNPSDNTGTQDPSNNSGTQNAPTVNDQPATTAKKDVTPKTGLSNVFAIVISIISISIVAIILSKKNNK